MQKTAPPPRSRAATPEAREREKRKAKLRVVSTDDDEFVRSVQADLEALPTIEERDPH